METSSDPLKKLNLWDFVLMPRAHRLSAKKEEIGHVKFKVSANP